MKKKEILIIIRQFTSHCEVSHDDSCIVAIIYAKLCTCTFDEIALVRKML